LILEANGGKKGQVAGNQYAKAAEFRAALRRFLRTSEEAARDAGITPAQHLLLLQIAGCPEGMTTVSKLVEKLALAQSAVTELVQRAEQAGLVRREVSAADARVAHLSLTPAGEARLAEVHGSLGAESSRLRRVVDGIDG
jgi:DNA-binding MarR family transcriptional regulator